MTDPGSFRSIPRRIWFYLFGRLVDTAATAGLVTIIGKQVFDMTGDLFALGVIGLVQFVPTFVLAPFAGPVADRLDRKMVAAAGSVAYLVLSVVLFFYIRTDPDDVLPIYGLMFIQGATEAFQRPAARALPIDLSPPDVLPRVMALNAATWQSGTIIGPVIAGFLFTVTIATPYAVIAVMYAAATVALLLIPPSGVTRLVGGGRGAKQAVADALEGFRYIRDKPVLGAAISLDLFAVLFGGAVALLPAIAEDRLGVGAVGLGWLRAAVGIGAAVVTLSIATRPIQQRVGPVLLWSVGLFGLATIALGLTTSFVVAMAALLTLGGADAVSVYIRSTLVPLATPENMRGRVLALENVFIGASNELGAFESGVTAAAFGLVGAVVFGGAATIAVVAAFTFVFPALRHIDRFEEVSARTRRPKSTPS